MGRFIAWRLALLVPTLLGVLVVTFLLLYVAPGDPVQAMVGERSDSATIARLRKDLHLDDPLPVQFGKYVAGIAKGDLGHSYITRRPIVKDLAGRFPATLRLAGAAMLFATVTGIAVGIYGAYRPGSWLDRTAALGAYLGVSFPVYWVGLLLILVFAVQLRWLPPSGSRGLAYLILPALTLGMRSVAFLSRVTRAAMQEVLNGDFVRTARAKGLSERVVVLRHAFRNALIPVVTVIGLDFGNYLTGSILTETIFSWPGVGRYVLNAITKRDLPAIQGSILFLSVVFVLVNLITDLVYAKVDPRVAYD
jgi:ABC-type dipeptide/oligopeptide/nickel transport system permease component